MKTTKTTTPATRNEKAKKILKQVDKKDLESVTGGACRTCGLIASTSRN